MEQNVRVLDLPEEVWQQLNSVIDNLDKNSTTTALSKLNPKEVVAAVASQNNQKWLQVMVREILALQGLEVHEIEPGNYVLGMREEDYNEKIEGAKTFLKKLKPRRK